MGKWPSDTFEEGKAIKEQMVKRQLKPWGGKGLTVRRVAALYTCQ